jgi:asparagine synthase (glutamine-hydrolysing)
VEHLIGDFAFAIWDRAKQRLFCARDHFGVKPFYYAHKHGVLVFSNTLACVRQHPVVSDTLNPSVIVDFLTEGLNSSVVTTTFADVQRLPAAHTLCVTDGRLTTSKYWDLPIDDEVRYRRDSEYVEHFNDVFESAVRDRVETPRITIMLSGGLDSTSIAAVASGIRRDTRAELTDIQGLTVVYQKLFPDDEGTYAEEAARYLGIPTQRICADDFELFEGWDRSRGVPAEPFRDVLSAIMETCATKAAAYGSVALTGDGGDEILFPPSMMDLVGPLGPIRLGLDMLHSAVQFHRRPAVGVRPWLARYMRKRRSPALPRWLRTECHGCTGFGPLHRAQPTQPPIKKHPRHPGLDRALALPNVLWAPALEQMDPGVTGELVEFRLPFLDVRLVRYALATPAVPWCLDKVLLRTAMNGKLPNNLVRRAKTPLRGDPVATRVRRMSGGSRDLLKPSAHFDEFIDSSLLLQDLQIESNLQSNLRALALSQWLHRPDPLL